MGIQDLGAIGEVISPLVIVVTLIVLIYETRGAKLGQSRVEMAAKFGLEPAQFSRLSNHYVRTTTHWRDAFVSAMPEEETRALDAQTALGFRQPAFAKWHDTFLPNFPRGGTHDRFHAHVAEIRATR